MQQHKVYLRKLETSVRRPNCNRNTNASSYKIVAVTTFVDDKTQTKLKGENEGQLTSPTP